MLDNKNLTEKAAKILGYEENIEEINNISRIFEDIEKKSKKRVLFREYNFENSREKDFADKKVFIGNSIKKFLGDPIGIALIATTLGIEIDRTIKRNSILSISEGFIYDKCSMIYIEEILDEWEEKFSKIKADDGKFVSKRYSPGYGDFPLDLQPIILRELEGHKNIGLTVTDSNILLPKKSVTAVIGIYDKEYLSEYSNCDSCLIRENCKKRERGDLCGY